MGGLLVMEYKDIRSEIKSGDLIAFSHGSWTSFSGFLTNIVRIFTRSTYSHVGVAWVIDNRVFVFEAVKPLTRLYPLSLMGDFYWIPTKANWNGKAETFAIENMGVEYSNMACIEAFAKELDKDDVRECAAYAKAILGRAGVYVGRLARPDTVIQELQNQGKYVAFIKNGGPK